MMYTITRNEFSDVHNGICELYALKQQVTGVIHPDLVQRLNRAFDLLEKGFANVREQENKEFDSKMDLFELTRKSFGFKSVWSIYDFDMNEGFAGRPGYLAKELVYEWDSAVRVPLPDNPTFLQLWGAADAALKESGDEHHVFIEGFRLSEDGRALRLITGS